MQAIASISQSALAHNLSVVRQSCSGSKIVSMVKADAYGHHLTLVDPIIDESDLLAVSELSEAQKLREKTDKPILLLSGVYSQDELQSALHWIVTLLSMKKNKLISLPKPKNESEYG